MVYVEPELIWMVVVGFIVAFALAFGIGANDVANSFGTSVGSKVLTLRQACILASIFETLGAVFLGAKVSDTIRKGIIDIEPYENDTHLIMVGNVAALSGSCIWMFCATLCRVPVSATHSIVGATVGFALVAHGARGIHWSKLGMIMGSWFISPVLSGTVSTLLFYVVKFFILNKDDPLEAGLRFLPVFYACTLVINVFSIFYEGPKMLFLDKIPIWGVFIISFGTGIICAILVRVFLVPWQRKSIKEAVQTIKYETVESAEESSSGQQKPSFMSNESQMPPKSLRTSSLPVLKFNQDIESSKSQLIVKENNIDNTSNIIIEGKQISESIRSSPTNSYDAESQRSNDLERSELQDVPEAAKLFSFLQVMTATFGSIAHGGNDVSNAIGPLVSLWLIATHNMVSTQALTPIWILFYGGLGISVGLWVWGPRVIKTVGEDLTKITPSSGFCIEVGSALTVLVASNVGIPISSTHCKIGSIVVVGRFRSQKNVDWSIFRNIILAWLLTLPISGGISAAIMAVLKLT